MLTQPSRDLTDHEGRAEEAEAHKQEQLQKQKEGKGEWVDELASDSESAVRQKHTFSCLARKRAVNHERDICIPTQITHELKF